MKTAGSQMKPETVSRLNRGIEGELHSLMDPLAQRLMDRSEPHMLMVAKRA
jgi:hypothetical protein